MSGWDIQAGEVSSIMTEVNEQLGGSDGEGGLVALIDTFAGHVETAAGEAGSGPITLALTEFAEEYESTLKSMVAKGSSAVVGCSNATKAYLDGDLEMAAEAQQNAGDISDLDL
ncbi:DUF6507 family protein [Salinactinospora qingdaonensis]|uniref:Excreted virulence factor EspC, type VII ESX diderm n=1 Tax=Salinactinospora qingdaonensis TaxID=702744 RepID=A0ABP7GGC8_9ACTN